MEIENARITDTMLGIEDHGILSFMLTLDYGGAGQGFGGYTLDEWSEIHKARIGHAFGSQVILEILRVVGVEKWEGLVGKYVRVEHDHTKVCRIGNILRDVWFDPKATWDEVAARVTKDGVA
jgi:hypothetical protein